MKTNDNNPYNNSCIALPFPPIGADVAFEMDIYARFMRHLRVVPTSRQDVQILSAIQYAADMMDLSDAYISKVLVDLGLRAPRAAFPEAYLEHADQSLMRDPHEVGCASASLQALHNHWISHGEDRFAAFKRHYTVQSEPLHV